MKVCMITGLNKLKKFIDFKNAGGMGTQVPILVEKLKDRGIDVCIDEIQDCDIIHLHNPMPNFLFLIKKANKEGKKIVIHARHLPELVKGGFKFGNIIYPIFDKYSRYLYNLADAVVCATPYVKNWMERNGIKAKLYVIPNGVDCSIFKPSEEMRKEFRKRYNLNDKFVVFSVGLMIPRKGIHDFVEVARKCKDMTFIWIGSTEKGLERVDIDFPKNFIHIPYLPFQEMPLAYNGGDVFFFPTYAESYGNVLMEAAACKKALVIRDIEVYKDWFIHRENCLKGKGVEEFVDAIEILVNDEKLRRKIADNAYETAKQQDISKTIDALIKMYEELMEE